MSYLRFPLSGHSLSGRTMIWDVYSTVHLGEISWYGPWRAYTFMTSDRHNILDKKCLREIADFCEAKTQEHRNGC